MPPLDEDAQTPRRALLIATSQYEDEKLRSLRAPGKDAEALRNVLADPAIGRYDVQTVLNERLDRMQRTILAFCQDAHPNELLLLYLSCHGILDDHGRLYYATLNTEYDLLEATALPADWLNQRLETCKARRQILILDCCHSGAFGHNALGVKGEADLALRDRFGARGRVVFTASRGTEYSFEGGVVTGEGTTSVFTKALVDGLRTGDADRDQDGFVSASELFGHVFDQVHEQEPRQTPSLWNYGTEGDLLVAWNPHGAKPVPLPPDLTVMVDSHRIGVRESAVAELAGLLDEAEPRLALAARNALDRRAKDDVPRVTALARAALAADKGRARQAVEAARTLVVDRGPQAPPAVPTPVEDRALQAPPAVPTPAEDRELQAPPTAPYNEEPGTDDVTVLRWEAGQPADSLFTHDRDPETVRALTEELILEDADVVMPVAGGASTGAAEAAAERDGAVRLVWFDSHGRDGHDVLGDEHRSLLLTSVIKDIAAGVYDTVKDIAESPFTSDPYVGRLANGGVRLGTFHTDVSDDLKEQVTVLADRIEEVWAEPAGDRCPS